MSDAKTFVLDVETDPAERSASLRLSDEGGRWLGSHDVRLEGQPASMWEALFDTKAHLARTEIEPGPPASGPPASRPPASGPPKASAGSEQMEQLAVFIGNQVLGPAILGAIAASDDRRTLVVRVSSRAGTAASRADLDPLALAFARVPWQLARPSLGSKPLAQRNVVVRVAPVFARPKATGPTALSLTHGEPLRVLFVFVEARGARPLSARLERERLRELFYDEIMPDTQVMLDVLCHGVTRERLRQKLRDAGGYHLIHWSEHGHDAERGAASTSSADNLGGSVSGEDLAEILTEAGGLMPQLVFLSASSVGPIGSIADWPSLRATLIDRSAPLKAEGRPSLDALLSKRDRMTDAAMTLLAAGVPSVVLTRHPAGCAYARRLGRRFYRSLLGPGAHQPADVALALAARELLSDKRVLDHHPADHASAVILGEKPLRFDPERGQSPDLILRRSQPQPLLRGRADLDPPRAFAGRGAELGMLAASWIPKRGAVLALIHGGPGVGKTALAAEAIHLWHRQFQWVLAFQARPAGLSLDDFYRELDKRLMRASPAYRERCRENEERRVYLPPRQDLSGPERYQILRDNLIDVLGSASILLVIDGFEENLGPVPVEEGHLATDPEWDALLRTLTDRLADVTGSRVLITSRYPIASIARSSEVVAVKLGPLLANEALSIVEESASLRSLLRGGPPDRELAWRVLETSAGHPPALQRLSAVARESRTLLEGSVGMRPILPPGSRGIGPPPRSLTPLPMAAVSASGIDAPPPSIRTGPASKRPVIAYSMIGRDTPLPPEEPPAPATQPSQDRAQTPAPSATASAPSAPSASTPDASPDASPATTDATTGSTTSAANIDKKDDLKDDKKPAAAENEPPAAPAAPVQVGSPDKIAQRAVALLVERLTPAERSLLWRITRAPGPIPMDLLKRLAELSA